MREKQKRKPYASTLKLFLTALCVLLIFSGYTVLAFQEEAAQLLKKGKDTDFFENFSMQSFDGRNITEENLQDCKLTMLNVWETTCTACVSEMPALEKLSGTCREKGVQLFGVCADVVNSQGEEQQAERSEAERIIREAGVTYPVLVPSADMFRKILKPMVSAFPTTFFIDSSGRVTDVVVGGHSEAEWEAVIDRELQKQ